MVEVVKGFVEFEAFGDFGLVFNAEFVDVYFGLSDSVEVVFEAFLLV